MEESWLRPESESEAGLRPSLSNHQREIIEAALAQTHGRVSGAHGAAAKLGVPRTTLESKITSLHIDKNRYRSVVACQVTAVYGGDSDFGKSKSKPVQQVVQ